jgi:LmbE family N-acetylglucosaminyl deacetylase
VFLEFADASRGRGFLDGLDPDVFSTSAEMVAVQFDAKPYLERKLSALTAHQSAFGVTPEVLRNPPPPVAAMLRAFRPVFEREVFVLGGTRGPVPRWPLEHFFEGLETAELSQSVPSAAAN